jgi:hypothetical protein
MEAVRISETSVFFNETTWLYIPEGYHLQIGSCLFSINYRRGFQTRGARKFFVTLSFCMTEIVDIRKYALLMSTVFRSYIVVSSCSAWWIISNEEVGRVLMTSACRDDACESQQKLNLILKDYPCTNSIKCFTNELFSSIQLRNNRPVRVCMHC